MNTEVSAVASGVEAARQGWAWRMNQFSLASLLVLVTTIAVIAGFLVQHQRHVATQAALSRYEAEQIPTSIPSGSYRVIAKTDVDLDHVKVATFRVECSDAFYGELMGRDGDGSGMSSRYNAGSGIHFVEWTYVFDHLPTENKLKVSNMGYALMDVPDDFSLDSQLSLRDADGIYERSDSVEAFSLSGEPYMVRLK